MKRFDKLQNDCESDMQNIGTIRVETSKENKPEDIRKGVETSK